ncbi:MAG: hypothetical protein ACQEXJ_02655 [Myxococcota bacterium]
MRRLAPVAAVLGAAAILVAGCTRDPEEAGPEALERALAGTRVVEDGAATAPEPVPFAGAEPHRIRMRGEFFLRGEPGAATGVEVVRTVDRGEGGAFRLHEHRTWTHPVEAPGGLEDGREAVFDGERFAYRRLWAPWMLRETLGGRAEQFLRSAYDLLPEALKAFGPYIRWSPASGGEEVVAGLPAEWRRASLDPAVRPRGMDGESLARLRDHEQDWSAWLAATHRPRTIEGRVARRPEGEGADEVLAGSLTVAGDATVEGQRRRFRLEVTWEVLPLPGDAEFTVPEDVLSARRPRPWKMIRGVLGDALEAPYRR